MSKKPITTLLEQAATVEQLIKQLQALPPETRFDPFQRLVIIEHLGCKLVSFAEIKPV
jgi:hypothetical protein